MNWRNLLSAAVVLPALTLPAQAGIFFNRHPKPNPADRVPQLIVTLRTGQDERKRAAAAEELRQFDPNAYPEIVPSLVEAVQRDSSAEVRSEAIGTLSHIRPVSQQAGMALEQAEEHDASFRVRLQARRALAQYRMSGYRAGNNGVPPGGKQPEPPLATSPENVPEVRLAPVPAQRPRVTPQPAPQVIQRYPPVTVETPRPAAPAQNMLATPVARPLPKGPAVPPVVPSETPTLTPPPSASGDDGPQLIPNF